MFEKQRFVSAARLPEAERQRKFAALGDQYRRKFAARHVGRRLYEKITHGFMRAGLLYSPAFNDLQNIVWPLVNADDRREMDNEMVKGFAEAYKKQ